MSPTAPKPAASPITIHLTASMGRGVFAARAIAAREDLGIFHTIWLPPREVLLMKGSTLANFWFEDDEDGSALVVLGFIELINHSTHPNADRSWRTTPEGEVVTLFALRDIEAGEQLFIDYKFDAGASNPHWA